MNLNELQFLKSQRHLHRDIIPVPTEKFIQKAERARTEIGRIYSLHKVNLNETKQVEISEDTPYYMWYPSACPRRMANEEIVAHELSRRLKSGNSTISVDWDKVLKEQDLIDEIRLFYPDINYEKEAANLREFLTLKLVCRNQSSSRLETAVPGSSYATAFYVAFGDGGTCEILWKDSTLSIVTNIAKEQDINEYVKWYFPKAVRAVRLTTSERIKLSKYVDRNKAEIFDNAVRIYFASWNDCSDALKTWTIVFDFISAYFKLFPRAFMVGNEWDIAKNARMTYRVKWFKHPITSTGVVILDDPRDQLFAKRVLFFHGYGVELPNDDDVGNVKIVLSHVSNSFQHDAIFREYIREMLSTNGISVQRAYLKRGYRLLHNAEILALWSLNYRVLIYNSLSRVQSSVTDSELHSYKWRQIYCLISVDDIAQTRVCRSIIEELIRKREWHGNHPITRQEWNELVRENLPWQWRLLDNNCNVDKRIKAGEAELTFADVKFGLRLLDMLTNDERELRILDVCGDPTQRIIMKPVYCIPLNITKEVRVACDKLLRDISEAESAIAANSGNNLHSLEVVDKTWTADYVASDDFDTSEGEISVQGWPIRHVEEVAMRLMSLFYGSHIDCSDAKNGRLLYGHGARYVEYVRKKLRGRVVIDVDLLGERITVVGEAASLAIDKLEFFAKNSHAFTITQRIEIAPPRYLHFMRTVLELIGFDTLREICGGGELERLGSMSIVFSGTLEQYDSLISCLDTIDEKLVSLTSERDYLSKPYCPVCLLPVSNAFYCLECGHYYCLKCIIHQVKTIIKNRMLPLRCVSADCDKLFSINDIKRIVLGEARMPWLSANKMNSLLSSSIDCLLRKDKSLFRCPSPDCFGIFTKKNVGNTFSTVHCDSCKREWCNACPNEPHAGVSCEVYALLRSDHTASLRAYKASNSGLIRDCPTRSCGAIIEKDGGCNHMHCTLCNTHFCWLCNYVSDSQTDVYKHLREEHGMIGDQWLFLDGREF
ncbi:hypothetical protein DICVIV_02514 [Dictyocaulus viviparus]|uniref:RBR-type E3 ubiquitin transferase n=1 Tax=Dictyocaulus viviparus TaxID=29172 RepID=A0A0D8Y9R9_DICVI|nr:hypothetical protein DICVIV_02514 [Dictyocaulus viviparus]